MTNTHPFTKREEIANAGSHAFGIVFSVFALVVLVAEASIRENAWNIVSFAIYGFTMLLLYVCSTLLHALPAGRAKNVFEILDHSSIYLFIAGTYTPILLIVVKGWEGWLLFGILWAIAVAGTVFKVFFVKEFVYISTAGYVLMGWMAVFVLHPIARALPLPGIEYLFGGGILYTVGAIFYVWRKTPYHHAIWHVFVLAGSVCHFLMMLLYVLPLHR